MGSDTRQVRLRAFPVTLAQANAYVEALHRHNGRLPGAKFALACIADDETVRGVAIAGPPKARMLDDGGTLEVSRVCTDGTPNACSALYGACARTAKAMGYWRVVTYTLQAESGVSLRAAGWAQVAEVKGESWARRNADAIPSYVDAHNTGPKWRWEIRFPLEPVVPLWPEFMDVPVHPSLFEVG
jgi:hypothetical protein